jgi:hypothetical protein
MYNASSRQLSDRDKQVRIVLYGPGQPGCILPAQPGCILPARLEAIFMRGASLFVDGSIVPAEGQRVQLALGYPTPILITNGKVSYAHPAAEGSHAIWIQFDEYCRGEPLHKSRDLIRALR